MSDNSTTEGAAGQGENVTQSNPPQPPNNPPPAQPPVHSATEPEWARNLGTSIASLPEVIARSVKEAIGTPAPTHQPKQESAETKETKTQESGSKPAGTKEEPGKPTGGSLQERFTNWWFGS